MNILIKFKNLIVESFEKHWKLIVALYIIFIIVFTASWFISGDIVTSNMKELTETMNSAPANNQLMDSENAFDIFVHNEMGGIITYIGSVFFAIPAIVMLLYNAANLGVLGPLFSALKSGGGLQYLVYLIPHGIFEITATVLESAAGILLFLFIWRFIKSLIAKKGFSGAFEENKKVLIHSIVIMIVSTILLLIAAPIEAYISVPLSEIILGI